MSEGYQEPENILTREQEREIVSAVKDLLNGHVYHNILTEEQRKHAEGLGTIEWTIPYMVAYAVNGFKHKGFQPKEG